MTTKRFFAVMLVGLAVVLFCAGPDLAIQNRAVALFESDLGQSKTIATRGHREADSQEKDRARFRHADRRRRDRGV